MDDGAAIGAAELTALTSRIFAAAGAPEDVADAVAEELVGANLAGHDSHGVIRVTEYLAAIAAGRIAPAARPRIVDERGATAMVSGEWGFGQVSGRVAADLAADLAEAHGVAAVALVRCNHLGRLGSWMERIAGRGCVGMMWVGGIGGPHQAVPYGGARSAYGANPLAAGFPTGAGDVVVDFATTAVAGGKVLVAHDRGEHLPPGSIVDALGKPTTDPQAFVDGGALLPFGGHKGYALAVLVELLGQALTGADATGDETTDGPFARSGALLVAIDAGAFRPRAESVKRAGEIAARIRATPPAPGFDGVKLPGDPEVEARQARLGAGIRVPTKTWRGILEAAERLGVPSEPLSENCGGHAA